MEIDKKIPYITRLYQSRKAVGRCPACGKPRDLPDRINCSKCLAYRHEIYVRKVAEMPLDRKVAQAEKARIAQKKKVEKRRSEGLCVICGEPSPDRYYCEKCREKEKIRKAKRGAEE